MNRIFILAGSILFIAAVIVWGISCATRPVSQPPEKTPVSSQLSTSEKKQTIKTSAPAIQPPLTSTATSVNTPASLSGKPVSEETIKIKKTPITINTVGNTTGPVPDSAAQVNSQPLPVFRPAHNYTGPTSVVENTATTQESTVLNNQITGFNPENIPVNNPVVNDPENTPAQEQVTTNPAGGPPVDPNKKTKNLPPFTPITNKTGPVKVDQ